MNGTDCLYCVRCGGVYEFVPGFNADIAAFPEKYIPVNPGTGVPAGGRLKCLGGDLEPVGFPEFYPFGQVNWSPAVGRMQISALENTGLFHRKTSV